VQLDLRHPIADDQDEPGQEERVARQVEHVGEAGVRDGGGVDVRVEQFPGDLRQPDALGDDR
jgi:hypothetical protein